ncbi:alpha/beta hydrolase [Streptomyces sp. NPDC053755]|uniref:alpha/beta hydrolase n=1 Tax=Streptomyces sp. NPDC053755 TaxID=3155815 RepID=UPI00343C1E1D
MSSEAEGRFHMVDVSSITYGPRRATLLTDDGVRIEAVYEPCTASVTETSGAATAVVVAHGFTGSVDRPAVRRASRVLAERAAVVTFSFRGHGRSGGRSTVGDREVLDLSAAVRWARALGHTRVVTVGFSMGGSVVLRHAALERKEEEGAPGEGVPTATSGAGGPGDTSAAGGSKAGEQSGSARKRAGAYTDAVAAVSAPARWYYRGTPSMRRVHWVITRRAGRLVGRYGLGTRIHHQDWDPVPLSPVEAVPMIAPTPLLIVHGDRDPYFPVDHPRSLAAAGPCELWLERGMGHAENAADDRLLRRLGDWLTRA